MKHLLKFNESINSFTFAIKNDKTDKFYKKEIRCTIQEFDNIDENVQDEFLEKMETKYNATMDYSANSTENLVYFSIYELEDNDEIFEQILSEWENFIYENVHIF